MTFIEKVFVLIEFILANTFTLFQVLDQVWNLFADMVEYK